MAPTGDEEEYPFPGLEGCVQMQDCVGTGMQDEVVGLVDVVEVVLRVVVGVQVCERES